MNLAKILASRIAHDYWRVILIIAVVAVLILLDSWLPAASGNAVLSPALTSWWMIAGGVGIAFIARRILFHRMDLQAVAARAAEDPHGAGMVFLGVCLVTGAIIVCSPMMLR